MNTPATRMMAKHGVPYTVHEYEYVEHGGTAVSSESLGASEHEVVKTLVMEDEEKRPLIVLMHGDRKVSTQDLARQGYPVGGTSPFGLRKPLPVFVERSILELPAIYINGGRRGFLVRVSTAELVRVLNPGLVEVALQD